MTRREEKEKALGRSRTEGEPDAPALTETTEAPVLMDAETPSTADPIDQFIDALFGSSALPEFPKYEFTPAKDGSGAVLTLQLQGYEPKDVSVTVQGRAVQVSVARELPAQEGQEEGGAEGFDLTFGLNGYADADNTTAQFKDGVLTVTLPWMESDPSQPRTIEIS